MRSIFEQVLWVLKNAGRCAKKNAQYYYANPSEAWEDLITYARENPKEFALTCALIVGGVVIIVLPFVIGFGPAGPILGSIAAGWQSGIGSVAAGSLFAILQSLAMTGVFTGIGATLVALGIQGPLSSGLLRSAFRMFRDLDSPHRSWYLDAEHTKRKMISEGDPESGTEEVIKRLLMTNSRKTYDMVWSNLDPSANKATIKEHAWDGFDVNIYFLEGPRVEPGDEGFYERFADHDTVCNENCECDGDISDVEFF